MRKRTRPFTEDCDAISEVIGELLMVVISLIAFGVLAAIMLSHLGPSDTLHTDVDGWVNVNADTICFRHEGGEAVEAENLEMILNLNGTLVELSSDDVTAILGDDLWQLGDIIGIDAMSRWGIDIKEDDYVGGTTIHRKTVIFTGTLLGDAIEATTTATATSTATPTPTPTPTPEGCPLSYWKFDESSGNTAEDSGYGDNNGTIGGATRVPGISGSALRFDNTSDPDNCLDYVTCGDAENLRFTDEFTLEAWVQVNSTQEPLSDGRIIDKLSSNYERGYGMSRFWGYDTVLLEFYADNVDHTRCYTNSTTIITDDTWHYVVGTYNGTVLKIYIDGILEGQTDTGGKNISISSNPLMIGCSDDNTESQPIRAVIDEVAVCGEALTDEEILTRYNELKPKDRTPISWWRFNEPSGSTVIDCIDGNNGTIINEVERVTGVEGGALFFNGSNYVSVPVAPNLNMGNSDYTIEVWAWVDESVSYSDERMLVEYGVWWPDNPHRNGTYQITSMNDTNFKTNFVGGCSANGSHCYANWTDSNWHHLVGVFNDSENRLYTYYDGELCDATFETCIPDDNNNPLFFGSRNGTEMFFTGKLDDIKIYDVALTSGEIRAHYNSSKPMPKAVVQWHFDEGTGSIAYDSAGSNNGTISAPVLWVPGINGSALDLEASSNNYMNVIHNTTLNITSNITIEVWVKPESFGDWGEIISKRNDQTGYTNYDLRFNATALEFYWKNGGWQVYTADGACNVGQWYHIIVTKSGTTLPVIYINGSDVPGSCTQSDNSCDCLNSMLPDSNDLNIGAGIDHPGNLVWFFDGIIDEVSVYDEILTDYEVLKRYNDNKP